MQEAFLTINGIKTNVLACGRWVEDEPPSKDEHIILVIPGNPGITGFYKMFMLALHNYTKYPVWTLSHAGHELFPGTSNKDLQSFKQNQNVFGLQGQIEHKVSLDSGLNKQTNYSFHIINVLENTFWLLSLMRICRTILNKINLFKVRICLSLIDIEYKYN